MARPTTRSISFTRRLIGMSLGVGALIGCQGSLVVFPMPDGGPPVTPPQSRPDASVPALPDASVPLSCGSGTTLCGAGCVSLVDDAANCGACGLACQTTEVCVASRCRPTQCAMTVCSSGQVCDQERCVEPACVDVTCGQRETCQAGRCVPSATPCDGGSSDDVDNCGGCGVVCPSPAHASARCAQARCGRGPCAPGFFDVDGEATLGCESTCLGASCTLPDGGTVALTDPARAHGTATTLNAGASMGATVMTGGAFRNTGLVGDGATSASSQSASGDVRHVGALTSFSK